MQKILHVEDDYHHRALVKLELEKTGEFKVIPALTISEALTELANSRFDLMICDGTLMHKLDGVALAHSKSQMVRVMVLSGDLEAKRLCLAHGIPYHDKYHIADLIQAVREMLKSGCNSS